MFYTSAIQWGNSILLRGIDENGPFQLKNQYLPTLFVNAKKESKYKLLDGTSVDEIKPGGIRDCKDFVKRYEGVEGFPIFGQTNYVFQYLSDNYVGEIKYDSSKIRTHFIDIETENEFGWPSLKDTQEKISLITIKDSLLKDKTITFSWYDYDPEENEEFIRCISETDMLQKYITWHSSSYPDVLTGWYSNGFDIPYLCRRTEKVLGEAQMKRLSPWNYVQNEERMYKGEMEYTSQIHGIALIDYMDLYKKFILAPRENYKLDYIAEVELGRKKLDYSEYASFKDFYTKDPKKFVKYNIIDTILVYELEDKLKLLEILFTVAYLAKVNYEDVFSPVKTWDNIIYNYLKEKNIVIPEQTYSTRQEYVGGYVKEPVKGMYKWIASFDLQSSYPHQIMQYAMSPENLIGEQINVNLEDIVSKKMDLSFLKERNLTMAANGWLYKKEQAMLPDLMNQTYNLRSKAKSEMKDWKQKLLDDPDNELFKNKISSLNNLQMAAKILINSLYGALGSPYFRYFDRRMAEGITLSGQLAVMWMERKFNEFFNKSLKTENVDYVLYMDTDSCYLNLERVVEQCVKSEKTTEQKIEFMDKFCREILSPYVNKCYVELANYMNAYDQKMVMARDSLSSVGIFCSKKKYILNEHDSEGVRYKEPKQKVIGLQMIQSSTPKIIKEKLKESLDLIINGTEEELQNYVKKLEDSFSKYSVDDIAKPTGVDGLIKYADKNTIYTKGTPFHVRGCLLYNNLIKELNLENKYQPIRDNDKVKTVYLKLPNSIKENIIAFPSDLPVEFDLHKYVDYETQFEKVYLSPLKIILDVIKWEHVKTNTLFDLFG